MITLPNLITCHHQSTSIVLQLVQIMIKPTSLISIFTQSSTIHLVYLILMNYLILLSLVFLTYTKLLYHWTLTNPLVLIILGQEYCIAVLKHFAYLFIAYSLYRYTMQLYLHAGKFTRWFLYLKLVTPPLSQITSQFLSYLIYTSKVLERLIFDKLIGHVTKSISPLQFGFTKNCSTLQQMLMFFNEISKLLQLRLMSSILT